MQEKRISHRIITVDNYWECDCDKDFIHLKNENSTRCLKCSMYEEEMGDARLLDLIIEFSSDPDWNFVVRNEIGAYSTGWLDAENYFELLETMPQHHIVEVHERKDAIRLHKEYLEKLTLD